MFLKGSHESREHLAIGQDTTTKLMLLIFHVQQCKSNRFTDRSTMTHYSIISNSSIAVTMVHIETHIRTSGSKQRDI